MNLVTIKGQTYNLDQMVRYIHRVGSREVGVAPEIAHEGRPIFGEYRYVELVFADGSRVELDAIQTAALLRHLEALAPALDLDAIDEAALGHVLVHNTEVGDVILGEDAPPDDRPIEGLELKAEDED
jgi:hypothetical protein